jgi:hypothetical protein
MKRKALNIAIIAIALVAFMAASAGAFTPTVPKRPNGIATTGIYEYNKATRATGEFKLTVPTLASDQEIMDLGTTQTATGKTFTAPTIVGATISGATLTDPTVTTGTFTGGTFYNSVSHGQLANKIAHYTVLETDCGTTLTNEGAASDGLNFTLPNAILNAGCAITFIDRALGIMNVDVASGDRIYGETNAADNAISSIVDAIANSITLVSDGGTGWWVTAMWGEWTDIN